jgi:hypothetical protein
VSVFHGDDSACRYLIQIEQLKAKCERLEAELEEERQRRIFAEARLRNAGRLAA